MRLPELSSTGRCDDHLANRMPEARTIKPKPAKAAPGIPDRYPDSAPQNSTATLKKLYPCAPKTVSIPISCLDDLI